VILTTGRVSSGFVLNANEESHIYQKITPYFEL